MKSSARFALVLAVGFLTTCKPGAPPAAGDTGATPPALWSLVPQDAFMAMHTADLPALLQGVSQYATSLLTGTQWEPNASKRNDWRQAWGFDPLQADSYKDAGIDVLAGALLVMLDPNTVPLLALGVSDPNLLDAALDRMGNVNGQAPQRVPRSVAGHAVLSFVAPNAQGSSVHRAFVDHFVLLARDMSQLETMLGRAASQPTLAQDANALRLWQRSVPGTATLWNRRMQLHSPWSVTSLTLNGNGMTAESLESRQADEEPGAGNAALQQLLQQMDPAAFFIFAAAEPAMRTGLLQAFHQGKASKMGWDRAQTLVQEATGLSLTNDLLPQLSGAVTADLGWSPTAGPTLNPWAALTQLQATLTVEVKDDAAVAALLTRCQAYMLEHKDLGHVLELSSTQVGAETVPIYVLKEAPVTPNPAPAAAAEVQRNGKRAWMRPARSPPAALGGQVPAPAAMQLGRVAVWHHTLVVAWGEAALNRTLTYLSGRPSHWVELNRQGIVAKHVEGRMSLMVLRLGRLADALAGIQHASAPPKAKNPLVDMLGIMRRLGDVVVSARLTPEGRITAYEQRFPVDTAQSL